MAPNDKKKSDSQLAVEAKKESYVQGEEVKDVHLDGDPVETGNKGEAIKRKLASKKVARDGGDAEKDDLGRTVDEVIVYPHREVQPHRIEQMFPETEIVYGAADEDKMSALSEAHAKGIEVDRSLPSGEIRSEIERVDGERQSALQDSSVVAAQMLHPVKTYFYNQMLELQDGQMVYGDLAKEMLAANAAEEVDG